VKELEVWAGLRLKARTQELMLCWTAP